MLSVRLFRTDNLTVSSESKSEGDMMSESEREFRQKLINELEQIRKHLEAIRANVEDMQKRLASLETSKAWVT
jgi:predicted transcriptional regulator